jgi:cyclic pyranopterin phosphate synthase
VLRRVIPLLDQRTHALRSAPLVNLVDGPLVDQLQRPLHDLRISVTDRCNFRCSYCMPKAVFDKNYPYLPHSALLSFEEITRVARVAVAQGVRKIRLTGGEPLLRKNIEVLIAQLAALRTPDGQPLDLTLTTNGALLARKSARSRQKTGCRRCTPLSSGAVATTMSACTLASRATTSSGNSGASQGTVAR